MNLTWHIVKKDIRRLRIPLLLWIALMAGQFILSMLILHREDENLTDLVNQIQAFDAFHEILWAMQLLACYVLSAWLIHEDALTGSPSWWMTRPISGARLLRAKLLGLVLIFCVLPALVALPWWLFCGFGPAEIFRAALEVMGWHAALVTVALVIAVVTEGAARFLFYTLVLTAGWMFLYGTIHELARKLGLPANLSTADSDTRTLVSLTLLAVIIGTVTVHQFLTRKTWRSWTILVSGLVLLALTVRLWRGQWNFLNASEPVGTRQVTIQPQQAILMDFARKSADQIPLKTVKVLLNIDGLPAQYAFTGGKLTADWRWPDGVHQEQRSGYIGGFAFANTWLLLGMKGAHPITLNANTEMPVSMAEKMRTLPPAWDATIEVGVWRGELVVELPLQAGAEGGRNGHHMRILALEAGKDGGLDLALTETMPVFASDDMQNLAPGSRFAMANSYYALVSRDRTKLVTASNREYTFGTRAGTVGVVRRHWIFEAARLGKEGERDWIKDAVLVKVAYAKAGSMQRAVHSDALMVEPEKLRPPLKN
ncbi:MAG: hypothetical protein PSU94_01550 [Lacunisphaera sp.]|nr:hypothetical protein [Lacunisphaera sp.]